jgi:hypothetical protein
MLFEFSDDQKALQARVRSFFDKSSPISVVRSVIDSEAGHDAISGDRLARTAFWRLHFPNNIVALVQAAGPL